MSRKDPRIDAYIAEAAEFARPILEHLRALIHATCPDVEESIKWGFPHYSHAGCILCSTAAFKHHAALAFWKAPLLDGLDTVAPEAAAMGQFGRLTSLADLPSRRTLQGLIRQAMQLNEARTPVPGRARARHGSAPKPSKAFAAALAGNRRARATFDAFPAGEQREYVEWIDQAKREPTRDRRIAQAVEWLAEGKTRNWKYQRANKP